MKRMNVEVEGGELLLESKEGHYAIIPAKDRSRVQKMINDNCDDCINSYIKRLPKESDYAEDGSLIKGFRNPLGPEQSTKEKPIFVDNEEGYGINTLDLNKEYSTLGDNELGTDISNLKLPNEDLNQKADAIINEENPVSLPEVVVKPDYLKYQDDWERDNPANEQELEKNMRRNLEKQYTRERANTIINENLRKTRENRVKEKEKYAGRRILEAKPQGDMSRVDYLNSLTDEEERLVKTDPRYQTTVWTDWGQAGLALMDDAYITEANTMGIVPEMSKQVTKYRDENIPEEYWDIYESKQGAINRILASRQHTDLEKSEMIMKQITSPIMSRIEDTLNLLKPFEATAKITQSIYRDDTTLVGALAGEKNEASLVEDIIIDVSNLFGVGAAKHVKKLLNAGKNTKVMSYLKNLSKTGKINTNLKGLKVNSKGTPKASKRITDLFSDKRTRKLTEKLKKEIDVILEDGTAILADLDSKNLEFNARLTEKLTDLKLKFEDYRKSKSFITDPNVIIQDGKVFYKPTNSFGLKQGDGQLIDFATNSEVPVFIRHKSNKTDGTYVFSLDKPLDDSILELSRNHHKLSNDLVQRSRLEMAYEISPSYTKTMSDNIDLAEKTVKGYKVYGGALYSSKTGVPHLTHDMDGYISQINYDKFVKNVYPFKGSDGWAEVHLVFPKAGNRGELSFTIIKEGADKKATGTMAEKLYRVVDPDGYFKQVKIYGEGKIKIPYTPDELLNKVDMEVMTMVDMITSDFNKIKHLNKQDAFLEFANPQKYAEAQKIAIQSYVGSGGHVGKQFDPSFFADVDENLKLLDYIGTIGNRDNIARSPERMQLALNEYSIRNTFFVRNVTSPNQLDSEILDALAEIPGKKGTGGRAFGGGKNAVRGNPHHEGAATGFIQHKPIGENTKTPLEYFNEVERVTNGSLPLNVEDKAKIMEVIRKNKLTIEDEDFNTMEDLIQLMASGKDEKILADISKATGIKSVSRNSIIYGEDTFVSIIAEEGTDLIKFVKYNNTAFPKSYKQRYENFFGKFGRTPFSELGRKEIAKLNELFEEGLDISLKRINNLEKEMINHSKNLDLIKKSQHLEGEAAVMFHYEKIAAIQDEVDKLNKWKETVRSIQGYLAISTPIAITGAVGAGLKFGADYMNDQSRTKSFREEAKEKGLSSSDIKKLAQPALDKYPQLLDYKGYNILDFSKEQLDIIDENLDNPEMFESIRNALRIGEEYKQRVINVAKNQKETNKVIEDNMNISWVEDIVKNEKSYRNINKEYRLTRYLNEENNKYYVFPLQIPGEKPAKDMKFDEIQEAKVKAFEYYKSKNSVIEFTDANSSVYFLNYGLRKYYGK